MDWRHFVVYLDGDNEVSSDVLKERIRIWRNGELTATDWTQLADTNADKVAFATYRQELRDLPEQDADPRKWVFPTRP